MTHSDLINECLLALSPLGLFWSNRTGAVKVDGRFIRYGLVGSSDILGMLNPSGRMIGVECKIGRDPQRKAQRAFMLAVRRAGGIYLLVHSVDELQNMLALEGVLS
jgi:hypothetical protein